ncbi:thymidine phosphorylase family protein [Bradymonas sediminis]|uniref:Thymidine phosphorylase n=1 Tax=Bradymonas sediminis TaxID=1548548 RepID=A0A2Z4FIC1_9DELT|nr:thymidine phosphorylase family protein [Bradymonas sediminis]AWV88682.1 thymidine phosphorylase [Bradymonas sediminis]TDP63630.1 thymidine phosphorylase [Bradymonas sediminis]
MSTDDYIMEQAPGLGLATEMPARIADSFRHVRAKINGEPFDDAALLAVMEDVVSGRYGEVHVASFLSACAGGKMSVAETIALTRAMVSVGDQLHWEHAPMVDKHCVGGLPGNRTTPIVVATVAACGLYMPKTSSRAITSAAGTADTMETLTTVNLSLDEIRNVVDAEGGCIAWGGSMRLSPADDILIGVERSLKLNNVNQLVASILSKKAAAGSSHILIDIPVGPSVKFKTAKAADALTLLMQAVAKPLGLNLKIIQSDGRQPVGRGIGAALEARDILAVLQNDPDAPQDLRRRSAMLAGHLLEIGGVASPGEGMKMADAVIEGGRAWSKFEAICEAQGGLRRPPTATFQRDFLATRAGVVESIQNRKLATVAKLAGAPQTSAAGLEFLAPIGTAVEKGQPLFIVHAESPDALQTALEYAEKRPDIVALGRA